MNILHLTPRPLEGLPLQLHEIMHDLPAIESRIVLKAMPEKAHELGLDWPYPLQAPEEEEVSKLIDWADIVLHHQEPWPGVEIEPNHFILYLQPDKEYQPDTSHPEFEGRKLAYAQYKVTHFTDAQAMPMLINMYRPPWRPIPISEIKIFMRLQPDSVLRYDDANTETLEAITEDLKKEHKGRFNLYWHIDKPLKDSTRGIATASIMFDDFRSGSYHRGALEGLAVGAAVFCNPNDAALQTLKDFGQTDQVPFIITDLDGLKQKVGFFLEKKGHLREVRRFSRQWMEKHWDPRRLVGHYLDRFAEELENIG